MTKANRIKTILKGLLLILIGLLILAAPEAGFQIILLTVCVSMTLRGFGILTYYLSMARHMVGGMMVLFRGIILLDVGLFSSAIAEHAGAPVILYIAGVNAAEGLITLLRAREEKINGSRWKVTLAYGLALVLMAAAVLTGGLILHRPLLVLQLYAGGLFYSAALTIASAFRRGAIVYIS